MVLSPGLRPGPFVSKYYHSTTALTAFWQHFDSILIIILTAAYGTVNYQFTGVITSNVLVYFLTFSNTTNNNYLLTSKHTTYYYYFCLHWKLITKYTTCYLVNLGSKVNIFENFLYLSNPWVEFNDLKTEIMVITKKIN